MERVKAMATKEKGWYWFIYEAWLGNQVASDEGVVGDEECTCLQGDHEEDQIPGASLILPSLSHWPANSKLQALVKIQYWR